VKYWEIVADNLSKSRMELGLRVSFGLRGPDDLDYRCSSRRRERFVMRADEELTAFVELGNSR